MKQLASILIALLVVAAATRAGDVHVINQIGNNFVPDELTVESGDTVQWVWSGGSHTVSSSFNCGADGTYFEGPLGSKWQTFEYHVPDDLTTVIPYICTQHCFDGMVGTLIVVAPSCNEDIDGDSTVGFSDVLLLLSNWGPCADPENCPADITGDGQVNFIDLLDLLSAWGSC